MSTLSRCPWGESNKKMQDYHDEIWGRKEYDDQKLYAKLMLDINQAGLSWQTILNKWDNFHEAYDQFDLATVANYTSEKVDQLMENPGIIRNRRKILAAITNAQKVLLLQKELGSFSDYLWGFVEGKTQVNHWHTPKEVPSSSPLSDEICRDLKKRGFAFVGTTTIYAFLQAVGIVNDHLTSCFCWQEVQQKK